MVHDGARIKDALNVLIRMFQLRADSVDKNDPTEQWLDEMYQSKFLSFTQYCLKQIDKVLCRCLLVYVSQTTI